MLPMLHSIAPQQQLMVRYMLVCCILPAGSKAADKRRKDGPAAARPMPAAALRWYVTAAELASVPSYIKGRLTLEKVGQYCFCPHCMNVVKLLLVVGSGLIVWLPSPTPMLRAKCSTLETKPAAALIVAGVQWLQPFAIAGCIARFVG
jgi:hypothetical protein